MCKEKPEPGSWAELKSIDKAGYILSVICAFTVPLMIGLSFYWMFFKE